MASKQKFSGNKSLPKVLVFDLDGNIWLPEMYQMWGGGGAPFVTEDDGMTCRGRNGAQVYLIGDVRQILEHLLEHPEVENGSTKLALASTCDEPAWAKELLTLFKLTHPRTKQKIAMGSMFHAHEIYTADNKHPHFHSIKQKFGVEFNEMAFYDNQQNNIRDVSKLGVHCILAPDGVMWEHFTSYFGPKPEWASRL